MEVVAEEEGEDERMEGKGTETRCLDLFVVKRRTQLLVSII